MGRGLAAFGRALRIGYLALDYSKEAVVIEALLLGRFFAKRTT
jgi:hypothetical protein